MEELETGGDAVLGTIKRKRERERVDDQNSSHEYNITSESDYRTERVYRILCRLHLVCFPRYTGVQKFETTSEDVF